MALRQRVWIDRNVQGALVIRVILYWVIAAIYLVGGMACSQFYSHPSWTASQHFSKLYGEIWPWAPTAILILPLVIFDVIRLSNWFVGPIYRLRQHLQLLINDSYCRGLAFRDDDYWRDLAQPINVLQAEIVRLKAEIATLQSQLAATDQENKMMVSA